MTTALAAAKMAAKKRFLRQRETTTEGSNHREREQLPQARVRPRRISSRGWVPFVKDISNPAPPKGTISTPTGQVFANPVPLVPQRAMTKPA
jgi:hypothetical protein